MKTLILSVFIAQLAFLPVYTYLTRKGFHSFTFPIFRLLGHTLLFFVLVFTSQPSIGLLLYGAFILTVLLNKQVLHWAFENTKVLLGMKSTIEDYLPSNPFKFPLKYSIQSLENNLTADYENAVFVGKCLRAKQTVLVEGNNSPTEILMLNHPAIHQFFTMGYAEEVAFLTILGILLYFI